MSDRDDLLQLIKDLAVVHGTVTLSSGREADWYIDLRRITLHRQAAPLVGRVMLEVLAGWSYDAREASPTSRVVTRLAQNPSAGDMGVTFLARVSVTRRPATRLPAPMAAATRA